MCSFFETLSLLLDFLITSSYYHYVLNRATRLVLVSLRKIVRRHGISKSVSNPFRLPLFLFFSLNFFRFSFFSGNGRSVFVDHREFWYGRPRSSLGEKIVWTCYKHRPCRVLSYRCFYRRVFAVLIVRPYRISTSRRNLDAFAVWWTWPTTMSILSSDFYFLANRNDRIVWYQIL